MNKKLTVIAVIYILVICLISFFCINYINASESEEELKNGEVSVRINEVRQHITAGDDEEALKSLDKFEYETGNNEASAGQKLYINVIISVAIVSILGVLTMFLYLDIRILRPFRRLKDYASELSKGNFDSPLKAERGNFFGDFTWAFDNLRRELMRARAAEKEAIQNNKTVIAALSHDIKTPVSSIRAYAEAFEANMDKGAEKREKYLRVLLEKCDEVSKLTNDLFLHSISEMDQLKVSCEKLELTGFIKNKVKNLFVDEKEISIKMPDNIKEIFVKADSRRLLQIFENLKNNAEKYAETPVEIVVEPDTTASVVRIHFRDFGPGISDEEIPFITNKFYRGKNAGNEKGSGLGLYIVRELTEKMGGHVTLLNKNPGLDVIIQFASEVNLHA